MFLLLKNADVYAPSPLGVCDVLIAAGSVVALVPVLATAGAGIDPDTLPAPCETLDLGGMRLVPGFVDGHVHVTGGGGEGGFRTRTPELSFGETARAGVTTLVGVLGTDGTARSMEALVAKIYALREEGLSAWCYTGSYRVPLRTITGEADRDIMMIEPVIGIGELAISDHRSSRPTVDEIARIASQARIGGMLSGKAGIVNVHLGDAPACLDPLEAVVAAGDIPRTQFLPTHCGRTPAVLEKSLAWARSGGFVDFTTSKVANNKEENGISAARAYARFLREGVPAGRMTFSSDGQGSLPIFDEAGRFAGLGVGTCSSLAGALKEAVFGLGLSLELALLPITSSPAAILKLGRKGRIGAGADADFVALDSGLEPSLVVARGKILVRDGLSVVAGTFERTAGALRDPDGTGAGQTL